MARSRDAAIGSSAQMLHERKEKSLPIYFLRIVVGEAAARGILAMNNRTVVLLDDWKPKQ